MNRLPITRKGTTVIAWDNTGATLRIHDCRSLKSAVALEARLVVDRDFAISWAFHGITRPSTTGTKSRR